MTLSEQIQFISRLLNQYALLILLLIVIFATILYLNRKKIRSSWQHLKTRYCLNRLGLKQVSDFQFPDGLGHYFTVDRLIMRDNGITLLIYKSYPGNIYCADQIDDWTQMLGQKSYRFKNPLFELDSQINTISAYVADVPVNGYLFFDHLANFPKGHPDRVINYQEIPEQLLISSKKNAGKSVKAAWKKLLACR